MTTAALVGYVLYLLLAFGLRSWLHWRETGSTGFVGVSGRAGSAEWIGGALFVVALLAGGAAPALQALGFVRPFPGLDGPLVRAAVIVLYVGGVAGTFLAQLAMGASWRIGVDAAARTELVETGPFRWVRNPIFSAMVVAMAGLLLAVPNVVAALGLVALVAALEIQVRLVEEPYLVRVHGERYRRYVATTGRFVPGVGGRMAPAPDGAGRGRS